jgi:DNA-binding MarR family transcriptional regulator
MSPAHLSTLLSKVLVAFTIELDNEFERRCADAGVGRRFGVSIVMWSNFMRFVGAGVTVGKLVAAAGLPKARVLSTLGGMERWRYVYVTSEPDGTPAESKRDGWGTARGLRQEWFVRPTAAGLKAQEIWPPLFDHVERRWEERFGQAAIGELRQSSSTLAQKLDTELPEYLPIVNGANGMAAEIVPGERQRTGAGGSTPGTSLLTLLAQVLLAYTLDFEHESELSLPLSANFVRVLDASGLDVRELPAVAGVSKEATSMALRFLTKTGFVAVEAEPVDDRRRLVSLTPKGLDAQAAARRLHATVEQAWQTRLGADDVRRLRVALQALLDERDGERARLSLGLHPSPGGWRATRRYAEQTSAVLADPIARLPHYPMVLPRGGWPDGS